MYSFTQIIGNVGKDAVLTYTPKGDAVAKFTVAVNKSWGKGEDRKTRTTWFRVTCWRELAETVAQYVHQGMRVMVIGEIQASAYLNKDNEATATLELTADKVLFLSKKGESEQDERPTDGQGTHEGGADIPF